jgi:hypothetical protein
MDMSYVLPLKWDGPKDLEEMAGYLADLSHFVEVLVIDGSPDDLFEKHRLRWGGICKHIRPHDDLTYLNGKVNGVLSGLREATHEHTVIADDDVRYRPSDLEKVGKLLALSDLVLPQNYFHPVPWHAHWDSARILLNRALAHDYPGTFGLRRSFLLKTGGYNGDVLFENLELIRTVKAAGGTVVHTPDLFVRRLPPTAGQFWSQRVRQAYDDLAQPWRLLGFLALGPSAILAAKFRPRLLGAVAAGSMALAESGRRRDSGTAVFRPASSLFAPLWLCERAACVWAAVARRGLRGGCRYGDSVIKKAATPLRELRRQVWDRNVARGVPGEPDQLV